MRERRNPGVVWFIPFHEHDPSTDKQCIYFTQYKTTPRCKLPCREEDNKRAIELHKEISGLPPEAVNVQLIAEYILYNCCRSGEARVRVRHRDTIEHDDLLTPLAERWQDEIWKHAAEQSSRAASVAPSEENVAVPATPIPSTAIADYQPDTPTSSTIRTTPPTSVTSSPPVHIICPKSSISSTEIAPLPSGVQTRYELRPRGTNTSTNVISDRPRAIPQPPRSVSEFRPHIKEPCPSDSVSSRLLDNLVDRDFETGSLYIFDRICSPGHVKIGWTAGSVSRRLDDWSKHGYTPNLLFSIHDIAHAQRVETLTHYELIKEWRTELKCKAAHCPVRHQEWFEVSKQRAEQVLSDWAIFMEAAEPYDSKGVLKAEWGDFVKMTVKSGENVTGKMLLEHYGLSLDEDTTLVEESVDTKCTLKIEEQEQDPLDSITPEDLEALEEALLQLDLLQIEQPTSTEGAMLIKSEPSPKPIQLAGTSLHEPKKQPKNDSIDASASPPSPRPKAESKSGLPASEGKDISRGQEESITPTAVAQLRHNAEECGQAKPESGLLRCDKQIPERAEDEDESAVTEIKSETGSDQFDAEQTLVEVPAPESFEGVAPKIVDGLWNETSDGRKDRPSKALDGLNVLKSEVPPADEIVARV